MEEASPPSSTGGSDIDGGGGGGGEAVKRKKPSNKEKYEFAGLETAIETLSQRSKELEGLLAGAQESGTG